MKKDFLISTYEKVASGKSDFERVESNFDLELGSRLAKDQQHLKSGDAYFCIDFTSSKVWLTFDGAKKPMPITLDGLLEIYGFEK